MTLEDLAAAAKLRGSEISDMERDRYKNPWLSRVLKVAKGLEVSLDDLLAQVDADYEPFRRDQGRHAGVKPSVTTKAGGDGTATPDARALELQEQIERSNAEIARLVGLITDSASDAKRLADKLIGGTNHRGEARDSGRARSGGSKGH